MTNEFRVMTSGAFTAAYLELIPKIKNLTKKSIFTASTSMGSGESSILNRLLHGEVVDIIIVAEAALNKLVDAGLVLKESHSVVAYSTIGIAVSEGAPKPDIGSIDALKRTLLKAKTIAYSASVSGQYVTTELYQRLGVADELMSKSILISGGERVGSAIARGDAEIGFQQISELLPVPGIAHITQLPPEVQKVSKIYACVATSCADADLARSVILFLASPQAAESIAKSGLEPVGI